VKVTAKVTRSGGWWAVAVPELPGVFTQAKRLDQVGSMVADAVATMLDDVSAGEVEVELLPDLPDVVSEHLTAARKAVEDAATASALASRRMREAVQELRGELDLSTRDAAILLGVSHQRVSQIARA
jgi:predicted RNase H-like HicB family nuclease